MQLKSKTLMPAFRPLGMLFCSMTALLISGCSTNPLANNIMDDKLGKLSANKPLRQLNPHPQSAYRVHLILKDIPGGFERVSGGAHFGVKNLQCGQENPLSGIVPRINSTEEFKVKKISETEYEGVFYTDMILDGDYYKKGLCKWKFDGVSIVFSNTVGEQEAGYSVYLDQASSEEGVTKTYYYWQGHYKPTDTLPRFIAPGKEQLSDLQEKRKQEYFTISIGTQKID